MIITKFKEHHLNEVVDIENRSFTHPWSRDSFLSELNKDSCHLYVALDNDKVVGYAVMDVVLDEGSLLIIAVDEQYRRKGVAKMLFDKLEQEAQTQHLQFITLEVRDSNNSAIALYDSLGFENIAVRTNYYSKPTEDAVIMTKYYNR